MTSGSVASAGSAPARDLPRRLLAEPALPLVLVAVLAAAPKAVRYWTAEPLFSLGLLVLPWAAWRVLRVTRAAPAPAWTRVAALAAAVALVAASWFLGSVLVAVWSVIAALAVVALERGHAREAALPLVLLGLTVPPPGFDRFLVTMQEAVAGASGTVLAAGGMPVTRDAWHLITPSHTFVVAPVCTGLSSLLATTALVGIVATHRGTPWRAVGLAVLVGGVATLLLNIVRVVSVVAATEWWGPAFVDGAFHGGVGLALSLLAFAVAVPVLKRGDAA